MLGSIDRELDSYDLQLLATASAFNLAEKSDRARSVRLLEHLFFRICRELNPSLFIEAGAKNATTSIRARRYVSDCRIVAFEANPLNYRRFAPSPALATSRVEYVHNALSDRAGRIEFLTTARDGEPVADGQGSILKRKSGEDGVAFKVEAVRLDKFFSARSYSSCCMWVDVEGVTREVLSGSSGLMKSVCAVFIEVEDRTVWDGQWLSRDVMTFMLKHELIPVARDFQSRHQYNVIFIKRALLSHPATRLLLSGYFSETHRTTGDDL